MRSFWDHPEPANRRCSTSWAAWDTNSEGKVIIDGVDISDFNAKQLTDYRRNNIGFVFQFYNLVANLTAKENVELASELVKNAADPVQTLVDVGLGGPRPQLATAQAQLASATASVASGQTQLQAARTQLAQGQNQLSDSWNQLANGKTQLDAAREQLETSKTVLDKVGATLGKWEQTGITGKLYEQIRGKYRHGDQPVQRACAE